MFLSIIFLSAFLRTGQSYPQISAAVTGTMNSRSLWVMSVGLSLALAGCGDGGPPRYHVKGTVKLGGRPVPAGQIRFDPDLAKGVDGPAGFAMIKNGEFDTRQQGQAQIGGPILVSIDAFDGKPGQELPMGRLLRPTYSTSVELPKSDTTKDFDVPASGN